MLSLGFLSGPHIELIIDRYDFSMATILSHAVVSFRHCKSNCNNFLVMIVERRQIYSKLFCLRKCCRTLLAIAFIPSKGRLVNY